MPATVTIDDAWTVFARAADEQLLDFMAERSPQAKRKLRRREPVDEREVLEAARAVLADVQTLGLEGFPPAVEASDEDLAPVARESIGQVLEAWWVKVGAPTLRDPDRRRQLWWWIQERVNGQLLPRP